MDHNYLGHNYLGPNYLGHNNIGPNYLGHNNIGHSYVGHNYIGHDYIDLKHRQRDRRQLQVRGELERAARLGTAAESRVAVGLQRDVRHHYLRRAAEAPRPSAAGR